jgi:hypothetical protein
MIEVIEGFGLGAGKSYYVVTRLIDHFIAGGTAYVVDTMEILWPNLKTYVEQRYGYVLQDSQYNSFSEDGIARLFEHTPQGTEECPVVIVVDESQGKLNARDWADKSKRELFDWACQSRHDDNDLWFISQSAHNIDKQIRRLATYMWRVRNTAKWGKNVVTAFLSLIRLATFGWHTGAYFVVSQLDQDGKTVVGRKKWIDQDPAIFKCYRSKAMRGKRRRVGAAVQRVKLERRKAGIPWVRWVVALSLLTLGVTGCSKLVHHYSSSDKHNEKNKSPQVSETPKDKPRAAYDSRVEEFRNQLGNSVLTTDKWSYERGKMSPDGIVDQILDGQARIKQADGRYLFVLTNRYKRSEGLKAEPVATKEKKEMLIVPDHGLFGPQTSPFAHDVVGYDSGHAITSPQPTPTVRPLIIKR